MSRIVSIVLIVRNGSLEGRRTWPGEFVGKVLGEFVAGEVGDGSEEDDGPDEARVAQHDALVGRELAQRLGEDDVVPVVAAQRLGAPVRGAPPPEEGAARLGRLAQHPFQLGSIQYNTVESSYIIHPWTGPKWLI